MADYFELFIYRIDENDVFQAITLGNIYSASTACYDDVLGGSGCLDMESTVKAVSRAYGQSDVFGFVWQNRVNGSWWEKDADGSYNPLNVVEKPVAPCLVEQEHSPDEHGQCDDCGATVFNPALEPLKVLAFAGFDGGDAAGLADGWLECDNEHVIMAAWQYLHNSRIAYQLDGNFSRKCRELIAAGKIFDAL